jgi:hypothetical protein
LPISPLTHLRASTYLGDSRLIRLVSIHAKVQALHKLALPYVDEIVSGDGFFQKIVPVANKTGHVNAKLLGNAEFLARF